jgi:ribosomal protein S18 acetylase RimI-like enzyme
MTVEERNAIASILSNIASKKFFVTLLNQDRVVSCGLAVLERQYVGIFNLVTDKSERRKGFAKQLTLNILDWAKQNGAKKAYLQVVLSNRPALNLYSKLGFQEIYQYFYRIKVK